MEFGFVYFRSYLFFKDMYGVNESSVEPLLGAPTLPTTSPPRQPRDRNRTWPKKYALIK